MANDMLQAILDAEEECKKLETDAQTKADNAIHLAKINSVQIIKDAKEKANSDANTLLQKVKTENQAELEQALQNAEIQCNKITANAERNRTKVITSAINYLIGL